MFSICFNVSLFPLSPMEHPHVPVCEAVPRSKKNCSTESCSIRCFDMPRQCADMCSLVPRGPQIVLAVAPHVVHKRLLRVPQNDVTEHLPPSSISFTIHPPFIHQSSISHPSSTTLGPARRSFEGKVAGLLMKWLDALVRM